MKDNSHDWWDLWISLPLRVALFILAISHVVISIFVGDFLWVSSTVERNLYMVVLALIYLWMIITLVTKRKKPRHAQNAAGFRDGQSR